MQRKRRFKLNVDNIWPATKGYVGLNNGIYIWFFWNALYTTLYPPWDLIFLWICYIYIYIYTQGISLLLELNLRPDRGLNCLFFIRLFFFYMFPVDRRRDCHKQNTIHLGIWNLKNWHCLSILLSLRTQVFDIIIRHLKCKILKYFFFSLLYM